MGRERLVYVYFLLWFFLSEIVSFFRIRWFSYFFLVLCYGWCIVSGYRCYTGGCVISFFFSDFRTRISVCFFWVFGLWEVLGEKF